MSFGYLSLFSGMGGGSLGFQRAGWACVGAVDSSVSACNVYQYLLGHPATVGDLAAMSPQDLRAICVARPDVVISSPPCKGNSGCLPASKAAEPKYQALNTLAFRGIWLALEAWPDRPPPLILIENVPRITVRSRGWLDQLQALLRSYGYACKETFHDCGELGGLAQHRKRFLLVARHMKQVPEFLYTPPKRRVRGIGELLGELPVPLPGSTDGGPMHALPKMSPLNWLRLALIPAGKDWRALPESVALSHRAARQNGGYGVNDWGRGSHAVVAEGSVRNTWASTADPRVACEPRAGAYGVLGGGEPSGTVVGHAVHDNSAVSTADPRVKCHRREGGHGVKGWDEPSTPIISNGTVHNHPSQVADPRLTYSPRGGSYGVVGWATPSHVIRGVQREVNGPSSVADPRMPEWLCEGPPLDLVSRRGTHIVIRAADGTWHRPMTDLELAVLQGFPARHRGGWLDLPCLETSPSAQRSERRQHIGNAIPPPSAEAIAREMATTLNAAREGGLLLGGTPVWVENVRRALSTE